MSLLPKRSPVESEAGDPRIVDVRDEDADDVFSALSVETGREVYAATREEPRTASDLAEDLDTSIQNVRYHLGKLRDAGLVEVVDTWYSSRGSEMKVYGTSDGPLVLFAGDDDDRSSLRSALATLVGGVAVLAGVGALLNWWLARDAAPSGGEVGITSGEATRATPHVFDWLFAPPGALFVVGGAAVLLAAVAWWHAGGGRVRE